MTSPAPPPTTTTATTSTSSSTSSASLANALSSLRTSTQTLATSLSILDRGIADLPRLAHVLTQTRHFELLPASALAQAQAALRAEIQPEVEALVGRVEAHVERLERREAGLRARHELQAGRLGRGGGGSDDVGEGEEVQRRRASKAAAAATALGPRGELKARQLRQKKERLSYAVERLTLQAQQTERRLRMSVAAQELSVGGAGEEEGNTTADSLD